MASTTANDDFIFALILWSIVVLPLLLVIVCVLKDGMCGISSCRRSRRHRDNVDFLNDLGRTTYSGRRFHASFRQNISSVNKDTFSKIYLTKRKELIRKMVYLDSKYENISSKTLNTSDLSIDIDTDEQPMCSICLSPFEDGDSLAKSVEADCTKCEHMFHYDCLEKWLMRKNNCPVCRRDLLFNDNVHKCDEERRQSSRSSNIDIQGMSLQTDSTGNVLNQGHENLEVTLISERLQRWRDELMPAIMRSNTAPLSTERSTQDLPDDIESQI